MASPPPEKPDPDSQKNTRPPVRRSWRRRLVILSSLLLVFAWLLNGPAARWAVHYGIEKAMTSIGMNGHVEVAGTLLSGLSLSNLDYQGDEGIESIQLKQLDLEYKVSELFDGKIRGLDITSLDLVIDYAKFPEAAQSEEDDTAELRRTLSSLRPYLTTPRIGLKDVDVTILNNGEKSAAFEFGALVHAASTGVYQLTNFQARDADDQQTPMQNAVLTWHTASATVDRLEVLPEIALETANIDWSGAPRGEARLLVDGAAIYLTLSKSLKIDLEKGEIRSSFFNKKFSLDLPAEFVVDSLTADISAWGQPIPQWQIDGTIGLKSLEIDEYIVQNTSIVVTQINSHYTAKIDGLLNKANIRTTVKGLWTKPNTKEWWADTKLEYELEGGNLATLAKPWLPEGKKIDLNATSLNATGVVQIKEQQLEHATAKGTTTGTRVRKTPIATASFHADYYHGIKVSGTVHLGDVDSPRTSLNGSYHLKTDNYDGTLKINEPDPAWLNAIASELDIPASLDKSVQLHWSGKGNLDLTKPQTGNLTITHILVSTPDTPRIQAAGKVEYNWPESVKATELEIHEGDWLGKGDIEWDGQILDLQSVSLSNKDEGVLSLTGKTPLHAEIRNAADFFDQKQPWKLRLKSNSIAIKKLNTWFQLDLIEGLAGNASLDLDIAGSPSKPSVNGHAKLQNVTGLDAAQREPLGAQITFHSEDEHLRVTSKITEGTEQRLNGTFILPFEPNKLVNQPDTFRTWLRTAKLEGDATINSLALERFSRFIPGLQKIQGTVSGKAKLSGTLGDPDYSVNIQVKAPLIQMRESGVGDIRDVIITATIDQTQKVSTQMTAQINGGKFEVNGTADLTNIDKPDFDLTVIARYALVHRDDLISVRANSDLRIKGSLNNATISGKIGIVESVVYKDMELIPIGVPSSEVAKVQLPALNAEKAANGLPIPAPFDAWILDLVVETSDPVLIRGNVASGQVTGSLKIGGTLSNPKPNGKLLAQDVTAKLPFSILKVNRGEIRFTPDGGLDPTLSVRGKSTVGSYDVSVFVYGKASSPKTTLSSFPPLPETEIMTLLGTGTTTSGLEDRDVATFKAFQIFLMKLKKRADKPSGNKLFKNLLDGVDELNLNVGEKDRFTGRKFSSATIELHRRWHLTAQVDAQQQTRGLIVYVIRFR